jgi:hypothetical protein
VVSPEERTDHIHPIELRDAKFRNAPRNDSEMGELAEAICKHVAAIDGPLADIRPLTAPNWYGMTPVGSTRFVGRLKEMWEIHSLLHAGDVAQITGAAAATGGIGQVQGLGGVGKSLLAEEYALHFGAAYPGGVFWVRAYGNDDAKADLEPEQREVLRADQLLLTRPYLHPRSFCDLRVNTVSVEEEEHRVHELEQSAENWSKAKTVPEYVLAVIDDKKHAGEELGPDTPTGIWVVWALQQVDRLDPLVKSPPSILDRKKELELEENEVMSRRESSARATALLVTP